MTQDDRLVEPAVRKHQPTDERGALQPKRASNPCARQADRGPYFSVREQQGDKPGPYSPLLRPRCATARLVDGHIADPQVDGLAAGRRMYHSLLGCRQIVQHRPPKTSANEPR